MSFIIVEIKTDHTDAEEAVRSVCNAMKRAGYDVTDYQYEPGEMMIPPQRCEGIVMAQEPEYRPPTPRTLDEKIAFRKDWDRRYEEGQARG